MTGAPLRVIVTGANGQLGSDVVVSLTEAGYEAIALTHDDVELTDKGSARSAVQEHRPDAVINTAAMNHVERCEEEPELAFQVNAVGVRNLALATAERGTPLMHVSTDYVFDGLKPGQYVETDTPAPVNAYGVSKLAGEHFVRMLNERAFIVRTSALYGLHRCRAKPHDNFVRSMLRLGRERDRLEVVSDERVSPTWTADLARQMTRLLGTTTYGTYHATSQGDCSWYEFARAIFEEAGVEVRVDPVTAAKYGSAVKRPAQSVLENAGLRRIGCDIMPHWRQSLRGFLAASVAAARDQSPASTP